MRSKFTPWLLQAGADDRGGGSARLPAITRGQPWAATVTFAADYSADDFSASLRTAPDASGATAADFTVTVGAASGGSTPVTLELSAAQTGAFAADADGDGLTELVWDMVHTPAGADAYRILASHVFVSGQVTP